MIFGLKDTTFLILAFLMSIVLFYSYLIQYLSLTNKKKITDYHLGGIIEDSNLIITIGFGLTVLLLGVVTADDLFSSGSMKSKLY